MKFLICWLALAAPVQMPLPDIFREDLVAAAVRLELCNEAASDISSTYSCFSDQVKDYRVLYRSLRHAPSLVMCAELPDATICARACSFYTERAEYCRKQRLVFPSANWPGFDSFQSDARAAYEWWDQARVATSLGKSTLERRLALQSLEGSR